LLGLATVVLSWSLLHTVFGLRYAHAFYGDSDQPGESLHAGGLVFPGKRKPDYFDFAYYSFVVGMTCQVSDVQITSYRMRRQKSADSPRRRQSAGRHAEGLQGKSRHKDHRGVDLICDALPFGLLRYTKPQDAV
jgi:hypothetical protein